MPLFVFPEGSRTPNGELQPFLSGAAFLAIRAQAALVPIALSGVYDLLPIHTRHFYPGEMVLTAGEPIETRGMSIRQADELTERLRSAIAEMLGEPLMQGSEPATATVTSQARFL
jgi:1-acyl-sn-glycerol-3-phosphate acyltransferase